MSAVPVITRMRLPIVGQIGDLELAAANIAALVEQPRRDWREGRGIHGDILARKLRALADELDLDEVSVGNDRLFEVDGHRGRAADYDRIPALADDVGHGLD